VIYINYQKGRKEQGILENELLDGEHSWMKVIYVYY